MKTLKRILTALLAACALAAQAQQDVSGTWAGTLEVGPDTKLNIHFILTRGNDGEYSAVVTSPDSGGIKDVAADAVGFEAGRLTLSVGELSGAYEGRWDDGGFTGEWRQEGEALPLRLEPYERPVLSEAAKRALMGSWVGDITGPAGSVTLVYRFETNDEGEFVGYLDSVDEGAFGIPMADIMLVDDRLSLEIPRARVEFTATVAGDELQGTWKQLNAEVPLTLRRGEYTPPEPKLSDEARQRLEGSWVGTLDPPSGDPIALVLRFETDEEGRFAARLDSPDQDIQGLPVSELELADGELGFRVPVLSARYSGTLGDERIDGTWSQGGGSMPVTLTPGEYTPSVHALELPEQAMQRLAGIWRGRLGPNEIVVRFETDDDGVQVGSFDIPAQGRSIAVTDARLAGGALSLAVGALGMQYTAELSGDEASGEWEVGPGNVLPVTLTRDAE